MGGELDMSKSLTILNVPVDLKQDMSRFETDFIQKVVHGYIEDRAKYNEELLRQYFIKHLGYMPDHDKISQYAHAKEFIAANRIDYYWCSDFIGSVSTQPPELSMKVNALGQSYELNIKDVISVD
jgi:hypothetical protein